MGGGASQVFFSPVRINIDQASQLYVPPGTDGRIIVLLKNDGVGDFFLLSGGDDKNFFIQFDYAQYVIQFWADSVLLRLSAPVLADDTSVSLSHPSSVRHVTSLCFVQSSVELFNLTQFDASCFYFVLISLVLSFLLFKIDTQDTIGSGTNASCSRKDSSSPLCK